MTCQGFLEAKDVVQRFMVVDNSDFSAPRLTALETLPILVAQGSSSCFPF